MRERRAFTLIELLTVISIIAILAAIMMPVIQSARKAAFKSVSSRSMSQIVTATLLYSGDHDQTFPPVFAHETPRNGGSQQIYGADVAVQSYVASEKIWSSPVDVTYRVEPDPQWYNDGDVMKKRIRRSYQFIGNVITKSANGYDFDTGMGLGFPNGYWDQPGRSVTSYERPSATVFLVEGWRADVEYSYLGSIYYGAVWDCLTWLIPGRPKDQSWKAFVPERCHDTYMSSIANPGYFGGKGLYAFADSRISMLTWKQVAEQDFERLRAVNRHE